MYTYLGWPEHIVCERQIIVDILDNNRQHLLTLFLLHKYHNNSLPNYLPQNKLQWLRDECEIWI